MVLGITGGIGSGKSTVCRTFEMMGIPVYNSDLKARYLCDHDLDVKHQIQSAFGVDIYSSGLLDRKKLGSIVFNQPQLLSDLNAIIHPAVFNDFKQWQSSCKSSAVIKEAAILFESGGDKYVDKVLSVFAPEELRITRVMKRDGLSYEEIKNRIRNQWDDERKINLSDFVINCDENQLVIPQVLSVIEKLNVNIKG